MKNDQILSQISEFCRQADMAESTFGRRAVNDGKLVQRLREGKRITIDTLDRIHAYIAGKELSVEDVRLTLEKVPDRLFEHPATVFVLTNMYYAEAPWLAPASPAAAASMIWHEVALRGASSGEFEAQIAELGPFLEQNWRANVSPRSGMPVYERPFATVRYREDHRLLLDQIIPRAARSEANFDLIIASQPYRAKSS